MDGLQRAAMEFQSTQSPVSIISPAQSVFEAVKKLERAATDQLGKVVGLSIFENYAWQKVYWFNFIVYCT